MKTLQSLACLTSKDYSRTRLQGINIKDGVAYATDGYILGYAPVKDMPDCNIPASIFKGFKDGKDILEVTPEKTRVLNMASGSVREENNITDNFPEVSRVINKDLEGHHVGLGLDVLTKIVELMKKSGNKTIELILPEDNLKSINGKVGEIDLVIMPVRINK